MILNGIMAKGKLVFLMLELRFSSHLCSVHQKLSEAPAVGDNMLC
jgi:hypothetical protein